MDEINLGLGYSYRTHTESGMEDEITGIIVTGPMGKKCPFQKHNETGKCAGGLSFENSGIAKREARPMWKVEQLDPLTITPSIRCNCDMKFPGQGQHGHITNGRWVNAGGIVE